MVYQYLKSFGDKIFPRTCLLCGDPGSPGRDLCSACAKDLPRNVHACERCALPMNAKRQDLLCGRCQRAAPRYHKAIAPWVYGEPLDHLLKQLKYHRQLGCAGLLGSMLADEVNAISDRKPEAIIPVPLHPARLRSRGFNQALELARPPSAIMGIPLLPNAMTRIRATPKQSKNNRRVRQANVRGAFSIATDDLPNHVAIVDDVVTSGSTVNEVARVLRAAGVENIEIWAVARTPMD